MGADGHILIVKAQDFEEYVGEDRQFCLDLLRNCYFDTLCGTEYLHVYWDDYSEWHYDLQDKDHWCSKTGDFVEFTEETREKAKEFLQWYEDNSTHWEVWT